MAKIIGASRADFGFIDSRATREPKLQPISSNTVVGKTKLGGLTKGRKRNKHGSSILSKDKRKTETTMIG